MPPDLHRSALEKLVLLDAGNKHLYFDAIDAAPKEEKQLAQAGSDAT